MSGSYHDDVYQQRWDEAGWLGTRWLELRAWLFVRFGWPTP